ncbi:hypothetical protein KC321_g16709, partial [Hortaea werneckii]
MATASLALLSAALPLAMASGSTSQAPHAAEIQNWKICKWTAWTWAAVVAALIAYRWTRTLLNHVRRLVNINHGSASDGKQKYFCTPNENFAMAKKHIITAPLIRTRHNREFKLSAAMNVGTLPGRLQFLFLIGYLAMQMAFVCISIDWSSAHQFTKDGRNRTGVLAVVNMIPLFLLAGRNNPLIWLCG